MLIRSISDMIYIPIGLSCAVPFAIKHAELRKAAYPFDWLFSPSKTTLAILKKLFEEGIDAAIEYMWSGWTYHQWQGPSENFLPVNMVARAKINTTTGLGITHYNLNDEYRQKLKRRFERFLEDIQNKEDQVILIYSDCAAPDQNYSISSVPMGLDASSDLEEIYQLLRSKNDKIKVWYFCWPERYKQSNNVEHIVFQHQNGWANVLKIISKHIKDFEHKNFTKTIF